MGKYTDIVRRFEGLERGIGDKGDLVVSGVSVVYDKGEKDGPKGERNESAAAKNAPVLYDQNDTNDQTPYLEALRKLESRCPDYVPDERWKSCLKDGSEFIGGRWGRQAAALGWTSGDLFGLHTPPANPRASYSRLSRLDHTGLVWILQGRRVTAMSSTVAAIETESGSILKLHNQGSEQQMRDHRKRPPMNTSHPLPPRSSR